MDKRTQTEIEAQTNNNKFITPLGLASANLPIFLSEVVINSNITLNRATHANRVLMLGVGCTQITLPPTTASLKNGDVLTISNESGSDITLTLNGNTTDFNATKIFNKQKITLVYNGSGVYRLISNVRSPITPMIAVS